jgi:hypothetical protein
MFSGLPSYAVLSRTKYPKLESDAELKKHLAALQFAVFHPDRTQLDIQDCTGLGVGQNCGSFL